MNLGFTFVPFPREIWDDNIEMTQAEFRLLGLFLYALKFGVQQLKLTDENILKGVRVSDTIKIPPLGLARNSMKVARDGLIAKNMLRVEEVPAKNSNSTERVYFLVLSNSDTSVSNSDNGTVKTSHSDCQKLTPSVSKSDTVIRNIETTDKPETPEKGESGDLFGCNSTQEDAPRKAEKFSLPSWVGKEAWAGFEEMRVKIKKPLTDRARALVVKELLKLQQDGYRPDDVLNQSVLNGWQDVYALKNKSTRAASAPPPTDYPDFVERNRRMGITTR